MIGESSAGSRACRALPIVSAAWGSLYICRRAHLSFLNLPPFFVHQSLEAKDPGSTTGTSDYPLSLALNRYVKSAVIKASSKKRRVSRRRPAMLSGAAILLRPLQWTPLLTSPAKARSSGRTACAGGGGVAGSGERRGKKRREPRDFYRNSARGVRTSSRLLKVRCVWKQRRAGVGWWCFECQLAICCSRTFTFPTFSAGRGFFLQSVRKGGDSCPMSLATV